MPATTILFGLLLIILGVGGYVATDRESLTALIPAIAGVLFVLLGAVGRIDHLRKHAMHAAAALALLGFFGTISGVIKLFSWMGGNEPDRKPAVVAQAIMAVLCLLFVILCVRSFIAARRARAAGGAGFDPIMRS